MSYLQTLEDSSCKHNRARLRRWHSKDAGSICPLRTGERGRGTVLGLCTRYHRTSCKDALGNTAIATTALSSNTPTRHSGCWGAWFTLIILLGAHPGQVRPEEVDIPFPVHFPCSSCFPPASCLPPANFPSASCSCRGSSWPKLQFMPLGCYLQGASPSGTLAPGPGQQSPGSLLHLTMLITPISALPYPPRCQLGDLSHPLVVHSLHS